MFTVDNPACEYTWDIQPIGQGSVSTVLDIECAIQADIGCPDVGSSCRQTQSWVRTSSPIQADANCTMVCIYMSVVLLASSLIYQFAGFGLVDTLGAVGLIYFSVSERRESFEKAAGLED